MIKNFIKIILCTVCVLVLTSCAVNDSKSELEIDSLNDLPPMVMIDNELYFDANKQSSTNESVDAADGEITTTVKAGQKPTENNQSNFGAGYKYQYGKTPGTVEIFINGKWWVYATEDAK